jgi:hypothetical protein
MAGAPRPAMSPPWRWWVVSGACWLLVGCATPDTSTPPDARGYPVCRFIDTRGEVWFTQCQLPPSVPTPGDGTCGDCCFSLPRLPGGSTR